MADRATARADRAAFDVLAALLNPWRYGQEDDVRDQVATSSPVDWPGVLAIAARHRVTPLLAERVKAAGIDWDPRFAMPQACAQALQGQAQAALASELGSLAELRRLKALFDGAGVPFLVFKGLVMSSACFGRLGLRINRDIDILVAPEDMERGHLALASAGYVRADPAPHATQAELARSKIRSKDWVYVRPGSGSIVELHHRLLDNSRLCDSSVLTRRRDVDLFGQLTVATLAKEDELAYLALHGAMHAWSRLKWLLDLAIRLRDTDPQEIDALLVRSRNGPAACALHQGIALCWRIFSPSRPRPRAVAPWQTALLTKAAMHTMAAHGAREIEVTRFGTTIKNSSHYLLWGNARFLWEELWFDLSDTSQDDVASSGLLPIWCRRPVSWLARRAAR